MITVSLNTRIKGMALQLAQEDNRLCARGGAGRNSVSSKKRTRPSAAKELGSNELRSNLTSPLPGHFASTVKLPIDPQNKFTGNARGAGQLESRASGADIPNRAVDDGSPIEDNLAGLQDSAAWLTSGAQVFHQNART
jgi:hypothetical protein